MAPNAYAPSFSFDVVTLYAPVESATPLPMTVVMNRICTVAPGSAEPTKVGVASDVKLSVWSPESLASERSEADGARGGAVPSLMVRVPDGVLTRRRRPAAPTTRCTAAPGSADL
jgi:hypothetical protein